MTMDLEEYCRKHDPNCKKYRKIQYCGEDDPNTCWSEYFASATTYVSLEPAGKWSQDDFFRIAGWICSGILLTELFFFAQDAYRFRKQQREQRIVLEDVKEEEVSKKVHENIVKSKSCF
jgi:hypothetical protein